MGWCKQAQITKKMKVEKKPMCICLPNEGYKLTEIAERILLSFLRKLFPTVKFKFYLYHDQSHHYDWYTKSLILQPTFSHISLYSCKTTQTFHWTGCVSDRIHVNRPAWLSTGAIKTFSTTVVSHPEMTHHIIQYKNRGWQPEVMVFS